MGDRVVRVVMRGQLKSHPWWRNDRGLPLAMACGHRAVPQLLKWLEADYWQRPALVHEAIYLLRALKAPAAVGALIKRLRDDDWFVRKKVVDALGAIGSPEAILSLIERLAESHAYVRAAAAEALGAMAALEAAPLLIERLADADVGVRRAAAIALGTMRLALAVSRLIEQLQDEDEGVRIAAAVALGRIGAPEAIAPLLERLDDHRVFVQGSAAQAVAAIGTPEAVAALHERLSDNRKLLRGLAKRALMTIGVLEAPRLARLGDDDRSVREDVVEALGKMAVPEALQPVIKNLADDNVSLSAWEALIRIAERCRVPISIDEVPADFGRWPRSLTKVLNE